MKWSTPTVPSRLLFDGFTTIANSDTEIVRSVSIFADPRLWYVVSLLWGQKQNFCTFFLLSITNWCIVMPQF